MPIYSETDLVVPPALEINALRPDGITTAELQSELRASVLPSGDDLTLLDETQKAGVIAARVMTTDLDNMASP